MQPGGHVRAAGSLHWLLALLSSRGLFLLLRRLLLLRADFYCARRACARVRRDDLSRRESRPRRIYYTFPRACKAAATHVNGEMKLTCMDANASNLTAEACFSGSSACDRRATRVYWLTESLAAGRSPSALMARRPSNRRRALSHKKILSRAAMAAHVLCGPRSVYTSQFY